MHSEYSNRLHAFQCRLAFGVVALLGSVIDVSHAQAQQRQPGSAAYLQCIACHTRKAGEPNKVGPNLANLFGRRAGTLPGYAFSPALKNSNIIWDEKTLDQWLTKPSNLMKGNKMAFPGIPDAARRRLIIEYLK